MGATISKEEPLDHFVLWEPTSKKTFYLRTPQMVANQLVALLSIHNRELSYALKTNRTPPTPNIPKVRFFSKNGAFSVSSVVSEWFSQTLSSPAEDPKVLRKQLNNLLENTIAIYRSEN